MAIGTPTECLATSIAANAVTNAFSPTSTVAAGTVAVLLITCGGNKTVASVADSVGGNTWTVNAATADGSRATSIASAQIVNAITTSDTITVTWAVAGTSTFQVWAQTVTGLAASSAFDKTATGSGSGTAVATADTAALSQADEIVFGLVRSPGVSGWTKGASYTNVTTPTLANNGACEYKIVAATTAVKADGTITSGSWNAVVATYKGAAAAAFLPKIIMQVN